MSDSACGLFLGAGKPLSKWMPTLKPKMAKNTDPNESRAVFVGKYMRCYTAASATAVQTSQHTERPDQRL